MMSKHVGTVKERLPNKQKNLMRSTASSLNKTRPILSLKKSY